MLRIALKMLVGDRAKYLLLVCALALSSLLMTQQLGIFLGLLRWTTASIRNANVEIWVADPMVEQANENQPILDTDLGRIRSVQGVKWAVPFHSSVLSARTSWGLSKNIQLIGVDPSTFIGMPSMMLEGRLEDMRQANAVIIDEYGTELFSEKHNERLKIGDVLEINDQEAKIVGVVRAEKSFFGYPYIYTTYERALTFAPPIRLNLSFVLAEPQESLTAAQVARNIEQSTGLKAYTKDEFFWSTIWWFFRNTGIPVSFGATIVMGFIVGLAVSGQTFYSFILENLPNIGALKAMGASKRILRRMIVLQAVFVGFIGYGLGVGAASFFGYLSLATRNIPFYLPYEVLGATAMAVMLICLFSSGIALAKIHRLDVSEVFRG